MQQQQNLAARSWNFREWIVRKWLTNLLQFNRISLVHRSQKDPLDRSLAYYLNEIIYLGRIYDFETENEHLVSAYQQFLDQTIDTKSLANTSAAQSFSNIVTRVRTNVFHKNFHERLWMFSSCHQSVKISWLNASSRAKSTSAWWTTTW